MPAHHHTTAASTLCAWLLAGLLCHLPQVAGAAPPAYVSDAIADGARWNRDRERDAWSRPGEILTFIGIEPGMKVLDLYTGGGYWAELFARVVGEDGHVVAHTNTAYRNFAGPLLDARFADGRVPRVDVLDAEIDDLGLGDERFDLIFIGLGYHDLYFYADFSPLPGRDRFFDQLWRALKPGGTVAIIDHAAAPGSGATAVQALHRIDEAYARTDWEKAGFEFVAASDALRNPDDDRRLDVFDDAIRHATDRFVYRFRKPAAE